MKDSIINRKFGKAIIIAAFWLGVWQILYLFIQRDIYLPAPLAVLKELSIQSQEAVFWQSILYSMLRVVYGISLSVFFGTLLGILAGLKPWVFDLLNPLVNIIKSTPVMSFIIIALIWFASSRVPVFICFLMCFPLIWTNMVAGVREVDVKLLEMAKIYHVKPRIVLQSLYLPSLMPYFISATTASLGLGWKASVAAEVLSHPRFAIGSNLHTAKAYLDSASLFAWTLVVVLMSYLFEVLFVKLIRGFSMRHAVMKREALK